MFNDWVAEVTWISGASMYPYFNADKDSTMRNDVVLNYKFKAQEGLKRGMIVTFWNPTNPESTAVKRIVGLEGDVVKTRSPFPESVVRVPDYHVWVQGDGSARDNLDSNTYGPVPIGLITGKVTHILYPFHKAGRVRWWEHIDKTKASR
ncbi:putative mitochondrial inner membrane protease subunit Imp2 [Microdochium trichocladiopsis]|uniref:Mitochondrial inner membrane protease subunit 2 n=1 Tax=Microdochium trichocladiopsis TaxID=1682393 RepID=A0A9P8YBD4_9PEZI|nr:putative mitochondrial inner membrane protease subunit Imp2 [Microdochium trichocladiopsis]KAH7035271.1 putative mitochondrial inner membrane protease subunit Imp2 [Microdochium trichocladiopsis]